jgi:hypothetical protein
MSVESPETNPARTANDPAAPGQTTSEPTEGIRARIFRIGLRFVQSLGAAGGALSLLWAAYTYSNQSTQQRRQELLASFDLVDGHLGTATTERIQKAISPFYSITDPRWFEAVARRDLALDGSDGATLSKAIADMQSWITTNILVKDAKHDNYLHAYQEALNTLNFTLQYAQADPCNATVVGLKFHQNVFDFFYYYPGQFDLDQQPVKASPNRDEVEKIADKMWLTNNIRNCSQELRGFPERIYD